MKIINNIENNLINIFIDNFIAILTPSLFVKLRKLLKNELIELLNFDEELKIELNNE